MNRFCGRKLAIKYPLKLEKNMALVDERPFIQRLNTLMDKGRIVGGAVVGSKKLVGEDLFSVVRTTGTTMSSFNA